MLQPLPWDSWFVRAMKRVAGVFVTLEALDYGADFEADQGHAPAFDPDKSAAAAQVFPWVYASVTIRTSKLSAIPVKVFRLVDGQREYIEDHWLLDLLERPNTTDVGEVVRREVHGDLILDGNAFVQVVGLADRRGASGVDLGATTGALALLRLPPKRVKVISSRVGVEGYDYDAGGQVCRLSPEQVIHIRLPSFRDKPADRLYGVGMIQPLADELDAEYQLVQRSAQNAKKGRPDVAISPAGDGVTWKKEQRDAVGATYQALTRSSGGALVLSGQAKVDPFSWSSSEMEGAAQREANRASVLAAARVPPGVAGLETANYATMREQHRIFWASLLDDARLIDSAFLTRLLRMAGERDTYAEHDFSGVRYLQEWQTEAINRAQQMWFMGIPLKLALTHQGLGDLAEQLDDAVKEEPTPAPSTEEEPKSWWRTWGRGVVEVPAVTVPESEDDRAKVWRSFISQLHAAAEKRLAADARRYLVDQGKRVSRKLAEVLEEQGYSPAQKAAPRVSRALVDAIFDVAAESSRLRKAAEPLYQRMLRASFKAAAEQLQAEGLRFDPLRVDLLVEEQLGSMVTNVTDATKAAVQETITQGLNEGASIAEMQASLLRSEAFSTSRALRIARTETTRSVNAGSVQAYKQADEQLAGTGVTVKKQWLSARDGEVRGAHRALDGQTVGPGEVFTVPAAPGVEPEFIGASGRAPGDFPQAGMVVNCRCTVIPVIEEANEEAGNAAL